MALFGFGKKKEEEKKTPACCCGSDAPAQPASTCCCGNAGKGIASVKVLGAGCKTCHEQYENAQEAVRTMGLHVEVEYITDMEKVMTYGVMSMPAIVVNEQVVSMGKLLKAADVVKLLRTLEG
ncbi:MAG: thioredoxin family protein [Aristaeellaceae bacterium]